MLATLPEVRSMVNGHRRFELIFASIFLVILLKYTHVLEKPPASVFSCSLKMKVAGTSETWRLSTKLHVFTSQTFLSSRQSCG